MRRRFFLFAAPAIVAAPSLMKISALAMPQTGLVRAQLEDDWAEISGSTFSDLITTTLRHRMPRIISQVERNNAILRAIRDRRIGNGDIRINMAFEGESA